MASVIPDELQQAYRATQYVVRLADRDFVLRIDEPSAELAELYLALSVRSGTFITAENPYSEEATAEDNARMSAALRLELERTAVGLFDGEGLDPDRHWPGERSFLALGLDLATTVRLGEAYGLNAVVSCDEAATPRLVLLR